jgi:hypothetical protein
MQLCIYEDGRPAGIGGASHRWRQYINAMPIPYSPLWSMLKRRLTLTPCLMSARDAVKHLQPFYWQIDQRR